MKKKLFCVFWSLVVVVPTLLAQTGKILETKGQLLGSTRPIREITPDPSRLNIAIRDKKGLFWNRGKRKNPVIKWDEKAKKFKEDPLRSAKIGNKNPLTLGNQHVLSPEISINKDGMTSAEITPADPTLCVGPNHVIQMVNGPSGSYFQVFNKAGQPLNPQIYLDNLVEGAGYSGAGDGICLYDQYADRYIMTEFGSPSGSSDLNTLVFFVSKTNDPLQSWYIYKFTDTTYFPDYPKISVWDDKSYFATSRDFLIPGSEFAGISFYAFNKQQMLSGSPTIQMQRIRLANTEKYDGAAPVNAFGPTPPAAGTPGLFTYRNDDGRTAEADADSVVLFGFDVDYDNPANSRFSTLQSLQTAPFSSLICDGGGYFQACVTVPGNNSPLLATTAFIMDKPVYRRYPTHESILVYHTVNGGDPGVAAIRWHELRRTTGDWQLYQEGTYSPDNTHRFFPSMNMNGNGQIAAVFNAASKNLWPSIRVAGRNTNDPLGSLPADETTIATGTGYGTYSSRWGDYNMISPDPTNDSLFWLTSMYGAADGWKTKLAAIKLAANKKLDAKLSSILSPLSGQVFCNLKDISTIIELANSGTQTLTSVRINWQLNNGPVQFTNWTGSLQYGNSVSINLPVVVTGLGDKTLRIFLNQPNGGTDERQVNDSLSINFTVQQPVTAAIKQGFESTVFPPAGWTVINPNAGSLTWARTTAAKNSGVASAFMNLFNYDSPDDQDLLVSPSMRLQNVDSVFVKFALAHKPYSYSTNFSDTLMLMASLDCGNSFTELLWKKGGADLASTTGTTGDLNWVPVDGEWKNILMSFPVSLFKGAQTVSFAWITINKFGQNIYIDDIDITPYTFPQLDASVSRVISPANRVCTNKFSPVIEVKNNGRQTLNSFTINLQLNNGKKTARVFSGLQLITGETYMINYDSSFSLPASGSNFFTAYISSPNGQPDQVPENDTIVQRVFLFTDESAPWKQSFENTSFPPANWDITNVPNTVTWETTSSAATDGSKSVFIRNYINKIAGDADELIMPPTITGKVDSIFFRFDLAYINSKTADQPTDTLQVYLTQDCGETSLLLYSKWGIDLETVTDPNFPATDEFLPKSKANWRTDSIALTGLIDPNLPVQLYFRNINNGNNNLYLDNIRLYTITLPAKLKEDGYLVTPNPTTGMLLVRQYRDQENLRSIEVVNMLGQRIWSQSFNGNSSSSIPVDISRQPAGVYIVRLIYNNSVKNTQIIKTVQ
ncbi:T9SS type A sorting domain-containing protein [Flavihumibacter profundi]|uniref:T9SS type A sorting domain-containing protein n=1 Tax=Flavihumibacter profundi TaxID=2716883 RepID=UPI001CC47374|nr:T9SS type A sorting domain-containing protein [Flavihumibacter profundi]MBZ5855787.1 T9SS type A sorting domain-containing protein [Flavihumibacter profundi]